MHTWIIAALLIATAVMGLTALAVILVNNMTFDDVVDAGGALVKQVPNQSARVIGQFIDGGP